MAAKAKIHVDYGYAIRYHEDGTIYVTVKDNEGETLEFDGIKGNLMDASDFESHYVDEDIEYTVEEYKSGTAEFLKDWELGMETIEAIIEDLTPWFKEYAIEEQKPEEVETKEFFWNDEVKDIDEAMNHMLDCIAICSKSEYEGDKVALEYCKSEYIRLAEVRAKAAKEWFAVW